LKLATQRRETTFGKKRAKFVVRNLAESVDGKEHEYTLLFQLGTINQ
jgi:hypothetical protein